MSKPKIKEILTESILKKVVVNCIASIKWKKSMRWGDTDLLWGRPLRSILAIYNEKVLSFNYGHLKTNQFTFIEKDLEIKSKKVKNFNDYQKFLIKNKIILNHRERKEKIRKKFEKIF